MTRHRILRSTVIVASIAALAGVALAHASRARSHPAVRSASAPLSNAFIARSADHWTGEGFVEMVGPVRPPTSLRGDVHIVVFLKLPSDPSALVRLAPGGGGDPMALEYPVGTVAERVEYVADGGPDDSPGPAWLVADVRGTVVLEAGQQFHVLRPRTDEPGGALVGLSWPRDDARATDLARAAAGDLILSGQALGPVDSSARAAAADHLRALNDCAGCHAPRRAQQTRTDLRGSGPQAGTDGTGFFRVSTVFSSRAPLERYRPRNSNAGDRFIHFVCGEGDASATVEAGGDVRCEDRSAPIGVLDVSAAKHAGDRHVERVCASRRYVYDRMDDEARGAFKSVMRPCDP